MKNQGYYFFRCSSCKTKNRISEESAGKTGKCGKCGSELKTTEMFLQQPLIITDANFGEKIVNSPIPALVDCWAPWCSPCNQLNPVITSLCSEYKGRFRIGKLNVDSNPVISARFDLRSIPTLLIFDNGQLKDTLFGSLPKHEIEQRMKSYL